MSDTTPTDPLRAQLAALKGWTPEEVASIIRHVKAPLEGFKHAILSGEMLLYIADDESNLARQARFVRGDDEHPAFRDFSVDEKGRVDAEGEARRKWHDIHRKNQRACLKTASSMFTKAAYFQGLIGDAVRVAAEIEDVDDDDDPEDAAERRRELEFARRLSEAASEALDGTSKREKNAVKRAARQGKEGVARRLAEIEGEAERAAS